MQRLNALILLTILISFSISGQINESIKQIVTRYPTSISNCEKIAKRINSDFNSEHDKLGAIYVWITSNISYDVKSANSKKKKDRYTYSYRTKEEKARKEKRYNNKTIKRTLRKRKAVCDGYSRLFKRLCDLTNIECVIVTGTSKTKKSEIGKSPKRNRHAWNAAKVNDRWELIDVTWGAGYVESKKFFKRYTEDYFCSNPEMFFLKHYPKDTRWLFTKKTKEDFANLPLYYSSYYKSEIKFNSSHSGVIESVENDLVHFKVDANGELPYLTYAFNNDKYSKKPDIEYNADEILFSIPLENRKKGYLTLYYRHKAIVTYKLNLR
ncbi:MAG: hypothetical protein MI866_08425 [Bacteroidales bacterium]|nr:hypothetical protein [Bacteroidales bacterium]